ncbi:MAG: hypothetical protein IIV19_05890, partial [Bacteroidaceae bacterium]|nr:hypothetical protein [Bacteroidaceae bacterium]
CRELFDYSSKLTTLEIGKNVTDLSNVSFQNCNNIKNVYSLNPVPPTIREYYTFNSFNRATLYVPYGALDTYKSNRGWRYFFKDILEFDATGIENVETDVSAFEITAEGIVFTAAEDKPVTIYTASGALVEKIDSYTGEEIILEKGVYIINVAGKSIKVKL